MRPIKFRVWDNGNEIYLYDVQDAYDTLSGHVKYDDGEDAEYDESCFGGFLNNERYDVEQYTGLKDANGKEIYECDIINWTYQWMHQSMDGATEVETNFTGVVVNKQGAWGITLKKEEKGQNSKLLLGEFVSFYDMDDPAMDTDLLGNVHENPELVEAKND